MRRTTSLTALLLGAALLGAALLVPTGLATAAGETCRGEAATIVGTGPDVQGTEGRDVIVSGVANTIVALGGDDLICVTGPTVNDLIPSIYSGPGNDVVDTTVAQLDEIFTVLGEGADQYFGGPAKDSVRAGSNFEPNTPPVPDNERDVIDTGAGADIIFSAGGTVPNSDVITAGDDDDYVSVDTSLAPDGRLDGGPGVDRLYFGYYKSGVLAVNATGTATVDGVGWLRWSGMEGLEVAVQRVDLTYTGSDEGNSLLVLAAQGGGAPTVHASLAGGDDDLTLVAYSPFGETVIDAGSGRDTVSAVGTTNVRANLRAATLGWGALTNDLLGVENVSAYGSTVRLIGSNSANELSGGGCNVRSTGAGGADILKWRGNEVDGPDLDCTRSKLIFDGGSGNDRLDGSKLADILRGGAGKDRMTGRQGRDTLIGGKGRDTALGGPNRDRCNAEVEKSCER